MFSFPGSEKGTLGALVYAIHHQPDRFGLNRIPPEALQALHTAAHLEMIDNDIRPALRAGHFVLLDRFWWSTWVYGRRYGAALATLDALIRAEQTHWAPIIPIAVILLKRGRGDQNLTDLYEELGQIESARHPVLRIPNELSPEETVSTIMGSVTALLRGEASWSGL
jgi:dTMP kinase